MTTSDTPDLVPEAKQYPIEPKNLDRLHDVFKLLDPDREGLGLDKVRIVFPTDGWHFILQHVEALITAGRLTKRPVTGKGGVISHEKYTWQEANNG
jgi:hypothetical protein